MTGIVYIGLEIGLHGENLPEMDAQLEFALKHAIRRRFPAYFSHEGDITVDFIESARSNPDGT